MAGKKSQREAVHETVAQAGGIEEAVAPGRRSQDPFAGELRRRQILPLLVLHLIEGQLVTPLVVGRRLALDPVMVLIALLLFGWLWGVAGLLLAMPLLTCVRIVAERIPAWSAFAKMLAV